eukprot:1843424-Pyramimonas_sp.AAC.1
MGWWAHFFRWRLPGDREGAEAASGTAERCEFANTAASVGKLVGTREALRLQARCCSIDAQAR